MKIIYRIFVLLMGLSELTFCLMCGVLMFLHITIVGPVVYVFTGKTLNTDYIYKLLDGYCRFVDELQRKGDYEQEDNSDNEEW